MHRWLYLLLSLLIHPALRAQTAPRSVLADGAWYRISTAAPGVYRVDGALLSALGLGGSLPSASLRLYGRPSGILPEAVSAPRPSDLTELAIEVVDGGDGVFSGSDYFLFYSPGPHRWRADTAAQGFHWQPNIYTDKVYYYLTLSAGGRRVESAAPEGGPVRTLTEFDEHYAHERDSVNLLSSGRLWLGEEFSEAPGRSLQRTLSLPLTGLVEGSAARLRTTVAARSAGAASTFSILFSGTPAGTVSLPAVGGGTYDVYARTGTATADFRVPSGSPSVSLAYSGGGFNSQGWLDAFLLFARRRLQLPAEGQLPFRAWESAGPGTTAWRLDGAGTGTSVWEVSEELQPVRLPVALDGTTLTFTSGGGRLREFIAFRTALTPKAEGRVAAQNLQGAPDAQYVIIAHGPYRGAAERLAAHHRGRGLSVLVVTAEEVFHEWSAGVGDPTAIRDFMKSRYDRFRDAWNGSGRFLLLLGKASFDYRDRLPGNIQGVPTWESPESLDPLATYPTDDYFGFLDAGEDISSGLLVNDLDLGIGRVPARSLEEAGSFVDKVVGYSSPAAFGPWRTRADFVADDEDGNLHLQDAEAAVAALQSVAPVMQPQKIYLDAFRQEGGTAGGRYPEANAYINSRIEGGTLLWNYSGHGGPARLAEEVVLDGGILSSWDNADRLPLFVTATCDFAPYDHPYAPSLGERLLLRPRTGAIALLTTTRLVFAFSNRQLNGAYLRAAFARDSSGGLPALGASLRHAKNEVTRAFGDLINARKFVLLGDPALPPAYPSWSTAITRINGKEPAAADTVAAGAEVVLEGRVSTLQGAPITDFNGRAYITVLDRERARTTLGNDPGSPPTEFRERPDPIFRGKATVSGGTFTFRFRLPRDLGFAPGNGRIQLYAEDGKRDGAGVSDDLRLGGRSADSLTDREGPVVKAWLNDERFISGGLTNDRPTLLLRLLDSSGINTSGSGIGHDLSATLDGDEQRAFLLNDFYESDLDRYTAGGVRYQLPQLEPGPHTLTVRAWDALNNASEYTLEFVVGSSESLELRHVLNYPNPFTTETTFMFEHNRPGTDLHVRVEVMTVSGRVVRTVSTTINNAGNRSSEVQWNGRDDWGARVGRGVYIYRLSVTSGGQTRRQLGRLVLL